MTGTTANVTDFETAKRQILDRIRIEEVVSEQVRLRRVGSRLVGLCPFHSEKTPSFSVNSDLGFFKCFGCGKGGDVLTYVQLRDRVPFMDALRLLADRAGVVLPSRTSNSGESNEGPSRVDVLRAIAWAQGYFRTQYLNPAIGRAAREYIEKRGFGASIVERFGIGLAVEASGSIKAAAKNAGFDEAVLLAADLLRADEESGRVYETFRDRLMFPIRDSSGRTVGFGGRTLVDDKAKYLNTRQNALFDKGRTLYGLDAAREAVSAAKRIIVVEGYTDCMACHQAGFTETVATLGTAMTEAHVEQLRRFTDDVILLFDSDAAGEAAADRAISLALPRCLKVRLARVPEGKDPGEFLPTAGAAVFSDVLNEAVDALQFKWSATQRRFAGDESDAKRRQAVLDFVGIVAAGVHAEALDAIQYGLIVNQVAHLLGMERADVARLFAKPATPRSAENPVQQVEAVAPAPRTSEQSAWKTTLEVLLNRPDLIASVSPRPDVSRISDPRDRRIASAMFDAGGAALSDVLARCTEPADAARVAELATWGSQRGNFEATLALSLTRIGLHSRDEAVEKQRGDWLRTGGEASVVTEKEAHRALCDGVKEHRHFVPRRMRRALDDGLGGNVEETAGAAP